MFERSIVGTDDLVFNTCSKDIAGPGPLGGGFTLGVSA